MLGELQALGLVVRSDALAVELVGAHQHAFVDEAADRLAMLQMNGTSRDRTSSTARANSRFEVF